MPTIPERELEILKTWQEQDVFAVSLKKTEGKPLYSFFDGPPFATGLPHYGHILASVAKDLAGRYWTMKGMSVPRRWGWDCHGLPIETIVEKELGISGKKQIEEKGIEYFNEACRRNVLTYADEWGVMIERIGRWVDFSGSYKTMDSTYMESVWWALKQLWDKKLIYQDRKVLLYCPRCETPISNFEVAMDDSYQDVTEESVIVSLPIKDGPWKGASLLAWTTTPWTLPANVALAVGPEIEYALVELDNAQYVLATARLSELDGEATIKEVKLGAELAGWTYEPLFTLDQTIPAKVVLGDFITTEGGTGIVHIAPAYGEDDFALAQKEQLPVVTVLDLGGKYDQNAPADLRGIYHKKAEDQIKLQLDAAGRLYRRVAHTHSYPFCWRCATQLYYFALPAWFINIQPLKPRLIELNEQITWHPDHLKHGRFLKSLEAAPDWNISRNRYWATALPFWVCECGEQSCIGSVAELKERAQNWGAVYKSEDVRQLDLHRPQIDQITLTCEKCGQVMRRVHEVIDCWVESGAMPFAEWHYPFENKEIVEQRLPADYVAEYIGQTRAWFYYMHVLSTILFDKAPFKHVVTTGNILNEKGEKMSKSLKNYPDPNVLINSYGVDALRLYLISSVVMRAENVFFNEREVAELYRKVISTWHNVVSFYQLYASAAAAEVPTEPPHILDRWMLARLNDFVAESTHLYDSYDLTGATRLLRDLVEDVSTWYVRRSRDRFKEGDGAGLAVFRHVLEVTAQVMAPIIPFTAEHTWQAVHVGESVHLTDWPTAAVVDTELLTAMSQTQKLASVILSQRMAAGRKVRQVLRQVTVNVPLSTELQTVLAEEVNVQQVVVDEALKEGVAHPTDNDLKIALDTEIDAELIELGLVRELARAVAERRKQAGLAVGEPAQVVYQTDDELIQTMIADHGAELQTAAHAGPWQEDASLLESDELLLDEHRLHLRITKA